MIQSTSSSKKPRTTTKGHPVRESKMAPKLRPANRPPITRRFVFTCLGVILTGQVLAALVSSPWFYIRHIEIDGVAGFTQAEAAMVRRLAIVPPKTNLILANVRGIESRITRLPTVRSIEVYRRPPGTLIVAVNPRQTFAILECAGASWEVDCNGLVIRLARIGLVLPHIELQRRIDVIPGRPAPLKQASAALTAARFFAQRAGGRAPKIVLDSAGDLCLNMHDGVVVRLGQTDELRAKLELVQRIYKEAPNIGAEVQAIDLRCPEAPACIPAKSANHGGARGDAARRVLPAGGVPVDHRERDERMALRNSLHASYSSSRNFRSPGKEPDSG